jgi:hypothetical protein
LKNSGNRRIQVGGKKRRNSSGIKAMTKTAPAHERVSHVPPSREGKKGVVLYLEPPLVEGLKIIAGIHGQSMHEYLAGVVEKDIAAQRVPGQLAGAIRQVTQRQLAEAIRQVTQRQLPRRQSLKRVESTIRHLTASIPR